jgi:hypothetical protein
MAEISLLGLAVNGFATGLGVVAAQHFYEEIVRPRIEASKERRRQVLKQVKNGMENILNQK